MPILGVCIYILFDILKDLDFDKFLIFVYVGVFIFVLKVSIQSIQVSNAIYSGICIYYLTKISDIQRIFLFLCSLIILFEFYFYRSRTNKTVYKQNSN